MYGGGDVFYAVPMRAGNTYNFSLTSASPGQTDFALFLLGTGNDASTCFNNSQDSIDDVAAEVISNATVASDRIVHLVVDAFSDAAGYPKYGSWTLQVTCTGNCVPLTPEIFGHGFED
jgi:hypothetical protein